MSDIVTLRRQQPQDRVFLQDGRSDNRARRADGNYHQTRDWLFQNVRLMEALSKNWYDVNYAWGMNSHGQAMGGAILPEMMRWLCTITRCPPTRGTRPNDSLRQAAPRKWAGRN